VKQGLGTRREPSAGGEHQGGPDIQSTKVDRTSGTHASKVGRGELRVPSPTSRITIRNATHADLKIIVALRVALLREHSHNRIYSRLRADAEQRAAKLFAAQLASPNVVIFLAELDGETVGILRCIHSTGSPLLEPAQYGYISSVYVLPKARERGVLRTLMAAADGWCRDRGLDEMRLHNAADNPLANAAWESLGFEVVELLRVRSLKKR
jgi:ribosomal protein S18 acetylase RimI-like enzyme